MGRKKKFKKIFCLYKDERGFSNPLGLLTMECAPFTMTVKNHTSYMGIKRFIICNVLFWWFGDNWKGRASQNRIDKCVIYDKCVPRKLFVHCAMHNYTHTKYQNRYHKLGNVLIWYQLSSVLRSRLLQLDLFQCS